MKIGIVGLGLIGGSIFKKLKENNDYELYGVSSSVNMENVDNDYSKLEQCEVVFVCTPMNITPNILDKLSGILSDKTIVSDVCSLKKFITEKKYNFKFIPSHPMAGTEFKGWENSFANMFEGATWAITPIENTSQDDIQKMEEIIKYTGATPLITTPEDHDYAVALISHAPILIAQALCYSIKDNPLAQQLAASGFRDTTRLALTNTEMSTDMYNLNNSNIKKALDKYKDSLDIILKEDYNKISTTIKDFRQNLYN